MVAGQIVLHHFHRFELFEAGFLGYLVLAVVGIVFEMAHVGDVADVAHFVAQMAQIAEEYVKGDCRAGVAEMAVAVDCRTADIHADFAFMQRFEKLLGARQGVIDGKIVFNQIHKSLA